MDVKDRLALLDELFGIYKAEWLHKKIFQFFAAPSYFNDLKNARPCIIQGGRGSGKTTVLRGLSYQGQYELNGNDIKRFDEIPYIGIYFRANTNHVRAFQGKGIKDERWRDIYAHYYNLLTTTEILYFLTWHKDLSPQDEELSEHSCRMIASSLHAGEDVKDCYSLLQKLEISLNNFQSEINNIAENSIPKLSMSGVPIRIVTEQALKLKQFTGKMFFLLVDEYENLLESQQLVMNTLLKHTPDSYTFKVGVREMGWKVKTTLNTEEVLNDPADYVLFDIVKTFAIDNESAKLFDEFAQNVCTLRLMKLFESERTNVKMDGLLDSMSIEDEAIHWGVEKHDNYKKVVEFEKENSMVLDIHPLYKFFLNYWAVNHNAILDSIIRDFLADRKKWNTRYENYMYSLLFKIKKGRGSGEVTKFYGGWSTFVKLANGNIRYLMELVYKSFYTYIQRGGDIMKPVPLEIQTRAAKSVGWKNLTELEASLENGAQLTRMVQSLGTIFGKMAKDGDRLAPEIVQFEIEGTLSERTRKLLSSGVMYLALVRMPSNKLTNSDVRDFMYSLHPIFSPYFNYSFRKKRKLPITEKEFLACIDNQKEGIAEILGRKNLVGEEERAETLQLDLFNLFEEND